MSGLAIPRAETDAAFRARHVGASEVAALFDASPWLTRFELWHRKNGSIATPDFGGDTNQRIEAGIRMEPVILDWASDRWGYERAGAPERLSNDRGLGGHPDRVVTAEDRPGIGILETKTADWLVAKKWGDEPPLNYLLQVQAYMGLAGASWGDLIVLVGGNDLKRFRYEFRPALFVEIERRVADFWNSIRAGDAPAPDFRRDGDAVAAVIGDPDDSIIDLRDDNRAAELAQEWCHARADRDAAIERMEAAKCEMLVKIGASSRALCPGWSVTAGQVKDSPGKLITAEMVGTIIGGRKGYRRFDIKEKE